MNFRGPLFFIPLGPKKVYASGVRGENVSYWSSV